ncbi:glycosyltransferase [Haloechinothrix alba]|uniref:glycosyltransferase n=1 Tax=Haloechinothrix alba TaxID=664784 RepID=UPI000B76B942|nr:nucleotide disphospho-sugar-binding domain-containing protein [Haloechinothrix alba]
MSRFLFVVPPFAGHVHPTIGVASELTARGHGVAWAGDTDALGGLLPGWARVYGCAPAPIHPRPPGLRGFGALRYLWEQVLVPVTESMVSGVEEAVEREKPDVLVVDQQAFAGGLVADRMGLPWVTSATTSAELTDPLAGFPQVRDWVAGQLHMLRKRFGTERGTEDVRFSPYLVLAFTTAALAGADAAGNSVRFVGPVTRERRGDVDFPWPRIDGMHPLVYITLGTVNDATGQRFLTECASALRDRPWASAVIADPAGALEDVPENVVVRSHVPQLELLDHVDVVLCHAGHNTVCEALSRGLPLVVAPIRDDQPVIADQVERSGAGTRLRFGHARASHIGAAIDTALTDPSYRYAAGEIAMSFLAAGGERAAADRLEGVLHAQPT